MNGIQKDKRIWLIAAIIILTATSWFGFLDKYSSDYTHRSILEAGAAYGISRGLNAAISVAQTSTIQLSIGVGGSVTIGEVLDPINDLIERFSQVVTVALSSLVLQKILLEIASDTIFKILCTLSGASVIALIFLDKNLYLNIALKVFFILILTRLALAIVLMMNSIVDTVFLSDEIQNSKHSMRSLQTDVENISDEKSKIHAKIEQTEISLAALEKQERTQAKKLVNLKERLSAEELIFENKMQDADITTKTKCTIGKCPSHLIKYKEKIDHVKKDIKWAEDSRDKTLDEIEDLKETLESYNDALAGKKPWYKILPDFDIDLGSIKERISNGIDNIITLLVLFVLKTIIIPVGFFYAFLRSIKSIWAVDWNSFTSTSSNEPINQLVEQN